MHYTNTCGEFVDPHAQSNLMLLLMAAQQRVPAAALESEMPGANPLEYGDRSTMSDVEKCYKNMASVSLGLHAPPNQTEVLQLVELQVVLSVPLKHHCQNNEEIREKSRQHLTTCPSAATTMPDPQVSALARTYSRSCQTHTLSSHPCHNILRRTLPVQNDQTERLQDESSHNSWLHSNWLG